MIKQIKVKTKLQLKRNTKLFKSLHEQRVDLLLLCSYYWFVSATACDLIHGF